MPAAGVYQDSPADGCFDGGGPRRLPDGGQDGPGGIQAIWDRVVAIGDDRDAQTLRLSNGAAPTPVAQPANELSKTAGNDYTR